MTRTVPGRLRLSQSHRSRLAKREADRRSMQQLLAAMERDREMFRDIFFRPGKVAYGTIT